MGAATQATMVEGRKDRTVLGILLVCLGLIIFSLQDTVIRAVSGSYALFEIVLIRSLIAAPLTVMILGMSGSRPKFTTNKPWLHLLRAVCMFTAYSCFYMALTALPLAETVALTFTAPLIIAGLSGLIGFEKVGLLRYSAVLVGMMGVLMIVRPGATVFDPAALLALTCAFCYAVSQMLARHLGASDSGALMAFYSSVFYLLGGLVLGLTFGDGKFAGAEHPSLVFLFRPWSMPTVEHMVLIVATGFTWAIGSAMMAEAYRNGEANTIAPFEYTAMIWALMWGVFYWGEVPTVWSVAGTALIAGSGLFVLWREHQKRKRVTSFQSMRTGGARVMPPPPRLPSSANRPVPHDKAEIIARARSARWAGDTAHHGTVIERFRSPSGGQ